MYYDESFEPEEIEKQHEELLRIFLEDISHLSDKTIRKHINNVTFFINDYLIYYNGANYEEVNEEIEEMAGVSQSDVGTGGMMTKLSAARIATRSGADMVIANGEDVSVISGIMEGYKIGTLFAAAEDASFQLEEYIKETDVERKLDRSHI